MYLIFDCNSEIYCTSRICVEDENENDVWHQKTVSSVVLRQQETVHQVKNLIRVKVSDFQRTCIGNWQKKTKQNYDFNNQKNAEHWIW